MEESSETYEQLAPTEEQAVPDSTWKAWTLRAEMARTRALREMVECMVLMEVGGMRWKGVVILLVVGGRRDLASRCVQLWLGVVEEKVGSTCE